MGRCFWPVASYILSGFASPPPTVPSPSSSHLYCPSTSPVHHCRFNNNLVTFSLTLTLICLSRKTPDTFLISLKRNVYYSYVLPGVTYGAETCTPTHQTSAEQTCGRTDQNEENMLNTTCKDRMTNIWVKERTPFNIHNQQCETNEVVLGRVHQLPQTWPMDLACHHLETILQEKSTRETSEVMERRPRQRQRTTQDRLTWRQHAWLHPTTGD